MTKTTDLSLREFEKEWRVPLIAHPSERVPAVDIVFAAVRLKGARLRIKYAVSGAIGELEISDPAPPMRQDELWKRTCFEVFFGDENGYYEFNFSPSAEWAAYRFEGYRAGMKNAETAPPKIETARSPGAFNLYTDVLLDEAVAASAGPWRLGVATVLKTTGGDVSHWALAHPDGPPDFHHASCFALQIP